MSRENPLWSRRRIASELAKLGHAVDKDTVAKYMPKPPARPGRPPSQTWKTFLGNHLEATIAIDFLTVPTVTFNVLYVFFVLSLDRRRVLHVNVTAHPYAAWTAQQIVNAIGAQSVSARLIRDRDASSARHSTHGSTTSASGRCALRRVLRGKTATRKDGSARYVASCSITSSCLGSGICCACSASMSPIITRTDLTCRSVATRRSRAPSNRRAVAGSSRFRASVGSTTVTRGAA